MKGEKVHFLGIRGSGMSGVACLAKDAGFEVDGCDMSESSSYSKVLVDYDIQVSDGHSPSHLENADLFVTSPSALFIKPLNEEVALAKKKGILQTWQQFLGKYLHKGKKVICVAGTHGKSTTTAMAALLLEDAGLEPNVMVGATIKRWEANFRSGKGDLFITESDEFNDNFLNYSPDMILLSNVEFDHPDYFRSEEQVLQSFKKHIENLKGDRTLIVNQRSEGVRKVLEKVDEKHLSEFKLIGYFVGSKPLFDVGNSIRAEILKRDSEGTHFAACKGNEKLGEVTISQPGDFNVENAMSVVVLSMELGIPFQIISRSLHNFEGIGRRMDLIGKAGDVEVYDDYAHHPTAVGVTLDALRHKYKDKRIMAVIEPHSFSRTAALLNNYGQCFNSADHVVIGPIFKARDNEDFGVSSKSVADASGHENIIAFSDEKEMMHYIQDRVSDYDVVIIMGAGKSHYWAKHLVNNEK